MNVPAQESVSNDVSIRAPVTRPGRPLPEAVTDTLPEFQSAPRSRDRGDRSRIWPASMIALFQSAPRSRDRGDFEQVIGINTQILVSIRAPVTRPGRHRNKRQAILV